MTRVIVNVSAVDTSVVTQGHTSWNKMIERIVEECSWAVCSAVDTEFIPVHLLQIEWGCAVGLGYLMCLCLPRMPPFYVTFRALHDSSSFPVEG